MVQASRAAVTSSLDAARGDLWLTKTSWEGKMRVCPREKPSGPVARNCRHRAHLREDAAVLSAPSTGKRRAPSALCVDAGRGWRSGSWGLDLGQPHCWEAR